MVCVWAHALLIPLARQPINLSLASWPSPIGKLVLLALCYRAKQVSREHLDLKPNVIDQLVESTRNDLRQIINILAVYKLRNNQMTFDDARKE